MAKEVKPLAHLDNFLIQLKAQAEEEAKKEKPNVRGSIIFREQPKKFNEILREEKARKEKITNDIREKNHILKEKTLTKLFWFLSVETCVIFALAFLQGFGWENFSIDEWSFRLVIAATLGQITAMLTIAVQHLFPKSNRH